MRVLISCPPMDEENIYLPNVFAMLKSSCDQNKLLLSELIWESPIFFEHTLEEMCLDRDLSKIDVLGLSCYTWNIDLNLQFAAQVKKLNPNCLIVMGGPEPNYRDPEFFRKHPLIDAIVRLEGESAFRELLEHKLQAESIDEIPGVMTKGNQDGFVPPALPPIDKTTANYWSLQSTTLELVLNKLYRRIEHPRLTLQLETDRGCPYGCTFCDWGSSTMSKIRPIPLEKIKDNIEWAAKTGIQEIYITSANFGLLDRDVEIAEELVRQKNIWGYPLRVYYSQAKSKIGNLIKIFEIFRLAGLCEHATVSLQSTNAESLKAIDRKNLSLKDVAKLNAHSQIHSSSTHAALIVGLPGDTKTKFKKSFFDLMEIGLLKNHVVHPFLVLENAPANDESYRKLWEMKVITRPAIRARLPIETVRKNPYFTQYCVQSRSFSETDFIEMWIFASFQVAFCGNGLVRYISQYLNFSRNISYEQFYLNLYEMFFTNPDYPLVYSLFKRIEANMREFLDPLTCGSPEIEVKEWNLNCLIEGHEYILVAIALQPEIFWKELEGYMAKYHDSYLEDLFEYQKQIVVSVHALPQKEFDFRFDWPKYFLDCSHLAPGQTLKPNLLPLGKRLRFVQNLSSSPRPLTAQEYLDRFVSEQYNPARNEYSSSYDQTSIELKNSVVQPKNFGLS